MPLLLFHSKLLGNLVFSSPSTLAHIEVQALLCAVPLFVLNVEVFSWLLNQSIKKIKSISYFKVNCNILLGTLYLSE